MENNTPTLSPTQLIDLVNSKSHDFEFKDVLATIDTHFDFIPTAFKNGNTFNEANQNNGASKVFAFAKIFSLNQEQTLALFAQYYWVDVLENPTATDHANIRNFMAYGWEGIEYLGKALLEK